MKSSILPYARLNNRCNILSYHYVRNTVAQGFIHPSHIPPEHNLADVISKNCNFQACYKNLSKPLLSYHGDGADYYDIMLYPGLDFDFEINIQAFLTSGLEFDEYPMGSDKFF